MASYIHGSENLPVVLKTTTIVSEGLTNKTVETVYNSSSVPAVTIGSVVSGLKIISYTNEPFGNSFIKQTIVYEGADSVTNPLPSTTYESQGSTLEVDIRQHPDWATEFQADWDSEKGEFKPDSPFYGISSYLVGTVTVTKTEYFATQPTDRYEDIGTLETPGGGYSGTNKWLIISTSRRKIGEALFARETVYQYNANGYNTTVYN